MSKMRYVEFIIFCVFVSRSLGRSAFEECTKQNTYAYRYLKMYPVDTLKSKVNFKNLDFRLEFYVKSSSNAHILLSQTEDPKDSTAYEIVLGAGQNSFSQIRKYGDGNKGSRLTPSIMSPSEFREFWIELKFHRLIQVGKVGETEPFLYWVAPDNPFKVKYFGFSTWNNVKGEWYFNCRDKYSQDPENMEGEGNMTDVQRLKNDLLAFYNPTNIPQREGYPDVTIEISLETNYFYLDEKRGELTLSGMADVKWTDWKLLWEPANYGDIKYIYVSPFHIWTPTLQVLNSLTFQKNFLLSLSGTVFVNSSGELFWRVPFQSVTLCRLGYENWPFDVHNCSLLFGYWTEPIQVNIKHMSVLRISKSEWEIQKIDGKDLLISNVDDLGGIIDISFRRREPSYEFLLLPPFLGATMLTLTSFWFQPNSSVKLFLNCGSILILILVLMSIGERLATVVTTVPKIVLLYSWSGLIMCIPIILYIGLKYVPPCIDLPRWLSSLLNSTVIKILFFLPENSESEMNYCNLREQEEGSITGMRLVTLIERFVFLIYFGIMIIPFFSFLTRGFWFGHKPLHCHVWNSYIHIHK